MESSEDDAGTATSASRGASARETDDGKSEDVDPTPRFQLESSDARMSCSTPTMSEDNFDGDSVPSPSAQDVNTSTEAILDMIDEFVDGPGAPKRLSLVSNNDLSIESTSNYGTQRQAEPPPSVEQNVVQPQESSPVASTDAENNTESTSQMSIECTSLMSSECTSQNVVPDCVNTSSSVSLPSTDTVQVREVESNEHKSADLDTENETVTIPTVSSSPSSSVQTVEESVPEINVENERIQETEPKSPIPDAENETVPVPPVSYSPSSSENTVQESVQVRNIESLSTHQVEPISSHLDTENERLVVPSVPSSPPCSEQTQDPVQIRNIETHSTLSTEPRSSDLDTESETVTAPSVSISSSSSEQSVQNVSDSSDCKRTVKNVTSSDLRDSVTVERAESTSSECSVTESRCLVVEPATRSPLRRRLVRPVPSDRRPDSTVSSTVDSHTPTVNTIPQTSSEVIVKDVSSSSDAVPSGNTKPEEISNVSEISICKAETSSTPSKKIKLIRPKITPVTSNSSKISDVESGVPCKDQCQSTSSDDRSMPHELPVPSLSTVQEVSKPQNDNSKPEIQHDVVNHNEIIATPEIHKVEEKSNKLTHIEIKPSIEVKSEAKQSKSNAQVIENITEKDSEISIVKDDHEKKVPPIKLSTPKPSPISEESLNNLEIDEKSDLNNVKKDQKTLLPEKMNCDQDLSKQKSIDVPCEEKKVPPIKLNLSASDTDVQSTSKSSPQEDGPESSKQVPKLTIKLGTKQSEEAKSPIPKLTIKAIRPPTEDVVDDNSQIQSIPNVTKINIKPIVKPSVNDLSKLPDATKNEISDQIPCITKLNIKPILKPPEKINDIHRKSSSSEISESEYSENDESTGTSDQASASDQGASETVPKVTIKLGKPGTESEGKFYTEQNIPKLTIKTIQQTEKDENESKLKLVISQSEEKSLEKIPKFTIKTMSKSENQPLSPKLTIKPIKPPETAINEIPKLKISAESCSSGETKDNMHVPKITIKPVTKTDADLVSKTKKSTAVCDSSEYIPLVTKLNIKPIIKPETREDSVDLGDKVPVVSKLNIKPIVKPKDIEVDSSVEDVPKIIKLNIKPLKSPEGNSSEEKDCDDMNAEKDNSSIPVVTKLNIKPIVKPVDDACKDTRNETDENQSSETGNSSDENNDHIPIVTKLNIKPILKPSEDRSKSEIEENIPVVSKLNIKPIMKPENTSQMSPRKEPSKSDSEQIPIVTKLNIKPLIKPEDTTSPASPKRESTKSDMEQIPVVTKLNIKPLIRPEDTKSSHSPKKEDNEKSIPIVTKLNIKPLIKPEETSAPASPKKDSSKSIPVVTKLNIKPIVKPDEKIATEIHNENLDKPVKNPPLVMKINMKNMSDNTEHDHILLNNVEGAHSPKLSHSPKVDRLTKFESKSEKLVIVNNIESEKVDSNPGSPSVISGLLNTAPELNCVPEIASVSNENKLKSSESRQAQEGCSPRLKDFGTGMDSVRSQRNLIQVNEIHETNNLEASLMKVSPEVKQASAKQRKSLQNCTLLKKLLSTTKDNLEKSQEVGNNLLMQCERVEVSLTNCNDSKHVERNESDIQHSTEHCNDRDNKNSLPSENQDYSKHRPIQVVCNEVNESVTRPLEISVNEKVSNQSSGQDSPRIILKINKTDHGASSKIITEETHKVTISPIQQENTNETVHDKSPKKQILNSRRKAPVEEMTDMSIGKRLRSSRVVDNADKTPILRRNLSKRPSGTDNTTSPPNNEGELSILEAKRLKLEQILSANKSLSITPVVKMTQISPTKATPEIKQGGKIVNQLTVNNENCPKNGNSKLHNILTNLQAKQMQSLQQNETSNPERTIVTSEVESNTSTGSSDVIVEITRIENCHPDVQEMIINENSDFRDMTTPEEISQDPLDTSKTSTEPEPEPPKAVEATPQPRKRGRPRKLPVSEGPKEVTPVVTALEERPQRSLRLTRERPAILAKPRGRGRGRGRRVDTGSIQPRSPPAESPPPTETVIVIETLEEPEPPRPASPVSPPIDPTSSRIKLPRMTEALDKSNNTCSTPLTTRRRSSLFGETSTDSIPPKSEEYMKSPEVTPRAGRGSRGARGGPRGRTPRNRGRGRGGGRGATYMKETMGIYGRVCGPATTTVELFEEETCMMDDNATPSKPSHLLDEDSQSSVKSSTNDSSNKMKKSKFADIFDSSKVWTAADVKEYTWPPPESSTCDNQVMMIQEQVAMFLGVKSFKRRYPELKRRPVVGEEKDYVLRKGVVTEALCDLGITAVDASDVLDIMLSDYPHKYEEYRSHQRQRQMTETDTTAEVKQEEKPSKIDVKSEKTSDKPEPPKVDPEKARQEMAAAAIASALEWNARCNALRRPACVDLQSMTVHRRRAPQATAARPPPTHCRPPAGFYPHALLPGQFQHHYRTYTPEQLRYFPLNTVIAAPPAPPSPAESSSESEGSWGGSSSSSDDSDLPQHLSAKRKKLTKVKRSSQQEKDKDESRGASTSVSEEPVDTCRVCKLRLEANRKYTHERFLVCANCNAKLHPSCLELNADTIRKCREYAWQCAECKSCCACRKPQDDDKMLFCDLCDRGFHIYCVGLDRVPQGRWHCVECAICKSCGAREPEGLPAGVTPTTSGATPTTSAAGTGDAEWHHQTRRGPGGHKVYSHSLCTPCARAYRIGRYCPLCERSFIGPKGTMQLVICKLCDRQLHQECVRPLVSALNVLDYTCGDCRRGGITSRAAAVRLAPRTIATLFMAKRRFNKYAHRQYMASRLLEQQQDDEEHEQDADADPDPDPGD